MKIGVITCHVAYNYGAMLQAYALYTYLKSQGHDVEYIDYRSRQLQRQYRLLDCWISPKGFIRNILLLCTEYRQEVKRKKCFEDFLSQHIRLTAKRYGSIEELKEIDGMYDAIICGSDQIWNANLAIDDDAYYLGYIKKTKKIAYAPSLGDCNHVTEQRGNWISQFENLSIREEKGKKLLECFLNKEIPLAIDPVFLLDRIQWNNIIGAPLVKEEYIYFYTVGERKNSIETARLIASKFGLKVVVSQSCGFSAPYPAEWDKKYESGPLEFINLIKHAKLVIGSSFHVAAFSLILQRPFYTLNPQDSRINTLLNQFNITGNGIGINEFDIGKFTVSYSISNCDYENDNIVTESKNYLHNALK